jgi:hypothetical protein
MRAGESATNKLNGLIPMPMDNIHSFDLFPKTRTGIYLALLILLVKQEFFELALGSIRASRSTAWPTTNPFQ